jgi:glycosyltransferase involved in cell wall biosynthesis
MRLSVVIPVFNEVSILADVVRELVDALGAVTDRFEVILSENGSTDGSVALVDALAEEMPAVRALHDATADYGFALRRGLMAAQGELVANFSVDWVDLQFLTDALPLTEQYDIVLASKHLQPDTDRRSWLRRFAGRTFHEIVRVGFGLPIRDTHGLKVMRRSRVAALVAACRYGGGLFDTELILRAHRNGLRMIEVPVHCDEIRPTRKSITGLAVRAVTDLIRMRMAIYRGRI